MSIRQVDAYFLAAPVGRPFSASRVRGVHRGRRAVLVRLVDDEGREGWGETYPGLDSPGELLLECVNRVISPRLVGADPMHIRDLTRDLGTAGRGIGSLFRRALSACDTALWDLIGQIRGRSMSEMLGIGTTAQYPAIATAVFYDLDDARNPDGRVETAQRLTAVGFRGVKVKVGGLAIRDDVAQLTAIRDALNGDVMVCVDANSGYTAATAVAVARSLATMDVYWFEEPVPFEEAAGYRRVADAGARLAGGQDVSSPREFVHHLESGSLDIIQPNVAAIGGPSEVLRACTIAEAYGARYCPPGWGTGILAAASLHLRHAIGQESSMPFPDLPWIEHDVTDNPIRDAILENPLRPEGGLLAVPTGPGLGVRVISDAVKDFAVTSTSTSSA